MDIKQLIDKTEQEAIELVKQAGYNVRVGHRDGRDFMYPCDWRSDRVNLHIVNDKVTNASIG